MKTTTECRENLFRELTRDDSDKAAWLADAIEEMIDARIAAAVGSVCSPSPHLCPKCNGQGCMSKPPGVPGDVHQWTSDRVSYECDVCHGEKILR